MHLNAEQLQLNPGRGIGRISFGDGPEQIQKMLGQPDETDEPVPGFLGWSYRVLKLDFGFLAADWPYAAMQKHMFQLTTRHPDTTLWGKKLIGHRESDVLAMFQENGYGSFTVSDETFGGYMYRVFKWAPLYLRLDFRDEALRVIFLSKP